MLTREYDGKVLADTVFMGKKVLEGMHEHTIHSDLDVWKKAKDTIPVNPIDKKTSTFSCIISSTSSSGSWTVPGVFIPTATTIDANVNDVINVLRCEIIERNVDITVTILEKVEGAEKEEEVISYVLPWKTRTVGYLEFEEGWTTLDPWRVSGNNKLHMCVPGIRSTFTCPMVDLMVEFLEYHFMQGVEHVYFGVDYAKDSKVSSLWI